METPNVLIALLGWLPFVQVLFAMLPSRRAMVVGIVGAWLFLPPVKIDLPGLPDYDKVSAAGIAILLATAIFDSPRLFSFRPRIHDLPIVLVTISPGISSISNGLTYYDALSTTFSQVMYWAVPFLIGRLYLTDLDAMREMAMGIIYGGICLIPFCLIEMKLSPVVMYKVYGIVSFLDSYRLGGYRPCVFFRSGLELGLWMSVATCVMYWVWKTNGLARILGFPATAALLVLAVTTVFCRSTGALSLLLIALITLHAATRYRRNWIVWILVAIAPVYFALRISNLWTGEAAANLVRAVFNESRARSLEYRFWNDNLLMAKAAQRPLFGWAGYGRALVYDEYGKIVSVPDGLWIAYYSTFGLFGLSSMTLSLLVPGIAFLRRFPVQTWTDLRIAPSAVIAVVVDMCMLDGLVNGQLNLVYIVCAGGLVSVALNPHDRSLWPSSRRSTQIPAYGAGRLSTASASQPSSLHYERLGRQFLLQDRYAEAREAWEHALAILARPGQTQSRQWCDQANNLAWMLLHARSVADRDISRAIELARAATESDPKSSTYWNTLGAALYRKGSFAESAATLKHAIILSEESTAFDSVYLAMALARSGSREAAWRTFSEAEEWLARNPAMKLKLAELLEEARLIVEPVASSASPS